MEGTIVEEGSRPATSMGARIDMQISASYQSLLMKSVIRDAVDSQSQIETTEEGVGG